MSLPYIYHIHTQLDLSLTVALSNKGTCYSPSGDINLQRGIWQEHSVLSTNAAQLKRPALALKDSCWKQKGADGAGVLATYRWNYSLCHDTIGVMLLRCLSHIQKSIFEPTFAPSSLITVWILLGDTDIGPLPLTPPLSKSLMTENMCDHPTHTHTHLGPFTPTDGLIIQRFCEQKEEAIPSWSPTISSLGHHLLPLCLLFSPLILHLLLFLCLTDAGVKPSSSHGEEAQAQRRGLTFKKHTAGTHNFSDAQQSAANLARLLSLSNFSLHAPTLSNSDFKADFKKKRCLQT